MASWVIKFVLAIMLPGSVVICEEGFASQRLGKTRRGSKVIML